MFKKGRGWLFCFQIDWQLRLWGPALCGTPGTDFYPELALYFGWSCGLRQEVKPIPRVTSITPPFPENSKGVKTVYWSPRYQKNAQVSSRESPPDPRSHFPGVSKDRGHLTDCLLPGRGEAQNGRGEALCLSSLASDAFASIGQPRFWSPIESTSPHLSGRPHNKWSKFYLHQSRQWLLRCDWPQNHPEDLCPLRRELNGPREVI